MAFRDRELFEYWGHEASLLPVDLHPLMRWRMRRAEETFETWGRMATIAKERPAFVEDVYDEVRDRGPISAGEVAEDENRGTENWGWNWTDAKTALEYLFWTGRIAAGQPAQLRAALRRPRARDPARDPRPADPGRGGRPPRAAGARGARPRRRRRSGDLADYFRIKDPQARPRLAELVEEGRLEQVEVRGWPQPAYLVPGTILPRRMSAPRAAGAVRPAGLRARAHRAASSASATGSRSTCRPTKRVHGYYVLPFLLGDALVARVDLKADRAAGVLRVQSAWAEPAAPADTADELAIELRAMAPGSPSTTSWSCRGAT